MTNPAPYIRTSLVTLLDNVISYDGSTVPVYENEGVNDGSVPYQILIKDQSGTPENTKHSFNNSYTTIIEVVSEGSSSVRKHVDIIGNSILALLQPTPRTIGLPSNGTWQVANLSIATNYLSEDSGAGTKIVRLILELTFSIVEK